MNKKQLCRKISGSSCGQEVAWETAACLCGKGGQLHAGLCNQEILWEIQKENGKLRSFNFKERL